jgi:hypothetical protein
MADKKISQLTNATTPLAGTEVLPIVQSGSTVKVSVANLTAGRTVDATTVNATTVDATNVEVTNIKAKDGTAAASIADSTGIISTNGNFLVGTTSNVITSGRRLGVVAASGGTAAAFKNDNIGETINIWSATTSGDNVFIDFDTETAVTSRGSISYNRVGGLVAYNTTSDYRAKDVYGLLGDSGATIDALKVYRGKMHGATMERPMLIAHEAQKVVPYAVSGEKDAVDENGNPKYQTMDHQIFVPLLIAEIQSLRARVAALEAAR